MIGTQARTAWLEAPGTLAWHEEALPCASGHEVLCETIVSVISPGTELAAWRGAAPLRPGPAYPRVQGYCSVAKVLDVGREVVGLCTGDRVLTLQSHRSHFACPASEIYFRLDPAMDTAAVATSYLFHLGYNAILRSDVRAGSRVVVIGLGTLGLTCVAMAALAGACAFAVSDHRVSREIAMQSYDAGGTYRRSEKAALAKNLEGGADVVILTTNAWADYQSALELAGQNAVIACLGFPGRDQAPGAYNPLAAAHFYAKQLRIEAVGISPLENDPRGFNRFNLRDNLAFIIQCIAQGRLDPRAILSGTYPAHELERAYTDLAARKGNAFTYLLDWAA